MLVSAYILFEFECANCYTKGVGYNAIQLNNKQYPIDSTSEAGHIEGKDFKREFN